jgi:ABC-type transport system substrate-binding protein
MIEEAAIRRIGFLLLAVAAAGCSGSTPSPSPTTTAPASPSASTAPSPTAPPSTTPSTATTPPTALPVCTSGQLRLSVEAGDSGAGQFHQRLVLTNSAGTCTLHGYPGVSFVDAAGQLLGSPAAESKATVRRETLKTGGAVFAVLTYSNAQAYPDSTCRAKQADRVRVYPPGERQPLFAPDPILVCSAPGSGQLHIGPIEST